MTAILSAAMPNKTKMTEFGMIGENAARMERNISMLARRTMDKSVKFFHLGYKKLQEETFFSMVLSYTMGVSEIMGSSKNSVGNA